ncbi:cardiolipin synthase [Candidatus Dependentiae bacterium]|nr:cardiolipin synthase [Candidatus Dependentiae bacterium]
MFPSIIIVIILFFFCLLIDILIIYHIVTSKRDPVGEALWILIVLFIPIGGAVLYLVFGMTLLKRKIKKYRNSAKLINQFIITQINENQIKDLNALLSTYKKTVKSNSLLDSLEQYPPTFGNKINFLLTGNEAYPEMLNAINSAKQFICLESYIFSGDNIGKEFKTALLNKAKSGVEVRLLYDPIGSINTPVKFWNELKRAGAKVYSFGGLNLLKRNFKVNFRNHRKNLIIDGKTAFSGGLNIHDENYNKYCNNKNCFVHDYHFKIEGPAVSDFQSVFSTDWLFVTNEILNDLKYYPDNPKDGNSIIRVIDSSPTAAYKAFSLIIFGAIMHAEKKIDIITPYFYPEPEIISALKYAGLSGIEVNIIIPQKNEHKIMEYASKSLYRELTECNINIFERKLPFIHSKSIVIDEEWAILGSGNLDYISLRSNYELCFEVIGTDIIKKSANMFESEKRYSEKISFNSVLKKSRLETFRNNFCALFAPML